MKHRNNPRLSRHCETHEQGECNETIQKIDCHDLPLGKSSNDDAEAICVIYAFKFA